MNTKSSIIQKLVNCKGHKSPFLGFELPSLLFDLSEIAMKCFPQRTSLSFRSGDPIFAGRAAFFVIELVLNLDKIGLSQIRVSKTHFYHLMEF